MWHGSSTPINGALQPRPSRVLNNERAVFATNQRCIALTFAGAEWTDATMTLSRFGREEPWYLYENAPGVFDRVYGTRASPRGGYLYQVAEDGFTSDPRLGMQGTEFVKRAQVPIVATVHIPNLREALEQERGIVMVEFAAQN